MIFIKIIQTTILLNLINAFDINFDNFEFNQLQNKKNNCCPKITQNLNQKLLNSPLKIAILGIICSK